METKQVQESECWNFSWFHCSSQEPAQGWQSSSVKGWRYELVEMGRRDLSLSLAPTRVHHRNPFSASVQPYLSKSHLKEEKPREPSAWKTHHIHGFHPFLIFRPLHFFPMNCGLLYSPRSCSGSSLPLQRCSSTRQRLARAGLRRRCGGLTSEEEAQHSLSQVNIVVNFCRVSGRHVHWEQVVVWWWSCSWKHLPSNTEDAQKKFVIYRYLCLLEDWYCTDKFLFLRGIMGVG